MKRNPRVSDKEGREIVDVVIDICIYNSPKKYWWQVLWFYFFNAKTLKGVLYGFSNVYKRWSRGLLRRLQECKENLY